MGKKSIKVWFYFGLFMMLIGISSCVLSYRNKKMLRVTTEQLSQLWILDSCGTMKIRSAYMHNLCDIEYRKIKLDTKQLREILGQPNKEYVVNNVLSAFEYYTIAQSDSHCKGVDVIGAILFYFRSNDLRIESATCVIY